MKTILVDAADTFTYEVDGKYQIHQPLYDLLEKYPNKKLIVTNANDEQMPLYGLISLPYGIFTLKHNPDKPDPIYFQTLLKEYNFKPEDVIYFEHNPKTVESAQSLGITSYFYDSEKRDLEALKKFIDENI